MNIAYFFASRSLGPFLHIPPQSIASISLCNFPDYDDNKADDKAVISTHSNPANLLMTIAMINCPESQLLFTARFKSHYYYFCKCKTGEKQQEVAAHNENPTH